MRAALHTPFLWLVLALPALQAAGQAPDRAHYLTVNGNLHLPRATPSKGVFPILWYDKEADPKVLIGGFGVGYTTIRPTASRLTLKGQANLSRHVYWDEPQYPVDDQGQLILDFIPSSSDFSAGLAATAQYQLSHSFSVGTGLGAQVLLLSLTRTSGVTNSVGVPSESKLIRNRYYKPVMPTVPVEVSLRTGAMLYNIRYELALLNRYKNELKDVKSDKYSLLTFEVGFRLGAKAKAE